jgi:hypothetical protein
MAGHARYRRPHGWQRLRRHRRRLIPNHHQYRRKCDNHAPEYRDNKAR